MRFEQIEKLSNRINHVVYGSLILLVLLFVSLLYVIKYHDAEYQNRDMLINNFHLVVSDKALKLLNSIDKSKIWFHDFDDNKIIKVSRQSLSPVKITLSEHEQAFLLISQIDQLALEIIDKQHEFLDHEFGGITSKFESIANKTKDEINKIILTGSYSSQNINKAVEVLISVTHQLQRLHQISYHQERVDQNEFKSDSQIQIIFLIVVLVLVGLVCVMVMTRYIRSVFFGLNIVHHKLNKQAMIIDQIHDSVISTDLDGIIEGWNKGAEKLYGYKAGEVVGVHVSILYRKEEYGFLKNEIIAPLKFKGSHDLDVLGKRKSGELFTSHLSLSMLYDDNGIEIGMIGYSIDISDRVETDKALKESQNILKKAQNIAKVGHWKLKPETKEVSASDELLRIFCLNGEQLNLDDYINVVHPDDREMDLAVIQRGIDYGKSWDIEHRLICCEKEEKWVHAVGEAILDQNSNVVELVGTVQDITQQKKIESEIEKSHANFKAMFESIPDAIVYMDPERNIQLVNNATTEMFGYMSTEIVGESIDVLYASANDGTHLAHKKIDVFSNIHQSAYDILYRRKNGNLFQGETVGTSVTSSSSQVLGYLGIIRDVSEKKHVELVLRSLAAGISGLDFDSFVNKVLECLTDLYSCQYACIGLLKDDGKSIETLAVRANGEVIDNFEYKLNGTPCKDVINRTKELIPCDVSKLYPDFQLTVDMMIESYFGAPLITVDGALLGIISVMDAEHMRIDEWTEPVLGVFATRVSLELERYMSNNELEQHREHLEELVTQRTIDLSAARDEAELANVYKSEFLSRMSHELRTPLNAILGFGQLLELDVNGFSETQRCNINEILEAGNHLLTLINEVLDLAQIESGKLDINISDVSVSELLIKSMALLSSQAEENHIKFIDEFSSDEYIVRADSIRLKQVFLNLISNALKYNNYNGHVTLEYKVMATDRIRICITDTGNGLTKEDIDKLFIPFERLNAVDNVEGTGIGLVITKRLIESMNGVIGVESIPGNGCTFWVELSLVGGF